MNKIKNIGARKILMILGACLTSVIMVTLLVFFTISKEVTNMTGKVNYFNCINAGLGCSQYSIELDNGDYHDIFGQDEVDLEKYVDKRVRIEGNFKDNEFYPGETFIVTSVEEIQ